MTTVKNLFHVRYGHSLALNHLTLANRDTGIAFASRQMGDNGVSAFIQPIKGLIPAPPGDVSVALGGNGVLSAFLQERPFYTGRDVAILSPKEQMDIRHETYRFNYGRKWNKKRMEESLIKLPAAADGKPDWQFMENYIKGLPYSGVLQGH